MKNNVCTECAELAMNITPGSCSMDEIFCKFHLEYLIVKMKE
jgi:hypothetical protein